MEDTRKFTRHGTMNALWLKLEKVLNLFTTSEYNPVYYLGAISIFFLWIIFITGMYLFIFYSISAAGAFNSVEKLTVNQWYLGGVIRSLHRYASQGVVITAVLHGFRHYVLDRYKHWRWLSWVTGVAMVLLIVIGGIFGYALVWDERAKYIAILSSRMLENIPVFGMPLSISFARPENLADQVFYLMLAIHFFAIIVVLIMIVVHLSRMAKSIINPPKLLAYGLCIALLLISFIRPAVSAAPANLKVLPQVIPYDWFFMFIFPLLKYMSERELWLFLAVIVLAVSIVPWLTTAKKPAAVELDKQNCTGCELCREDCPYSAIQMRKRTDGMPYELEAYVLPERCASCGICMGSCDYKALNLPGLTEDWIKGEIERLSTELQGARDKKVMVFSCAKGALLGGKVDPAGKAGLDWARVITLQCIGMLQPSMLEMAFQKGIDGVYIAACRHGDCSFRRGNEWLDGRLSGLRMPVVKKSLDRSKIEMAWLSEAEDAGFLEGLNRFQTNLKDQRSA